jgi:hypothetical protein
VCRRSRLLQDEAEAAVGTELMLKFRLITPDRGFPFLSSSLTASSTRMQRSSSPNCRRAWLQPWQTPAGVLRTRATTSTTGSVTRRDGVIPITVKCVGL